MTASEWMSHEGQWWIPEPNTGCWLWTRAVTLAGYGRTGPKTYAHRVAYEALRGPIPPDLQIDHLCRVRSCVNPDHMECVTSRENTLRGNGPSAIEARQTHCKNGHPFAEPHLTIRKNGTRLCQTCSNASLRAWRALARVEGGKP